MENFNKGDRIMVSVRRMQQPTDDLFNYSHLNNTDTDDFENTDLTSLVYEVIEELSESIDISNAKIKVGDLPVVMATPSLMRQLIINLFSNALKYKSKLANPIISLSSSVADKSEIAGTADIRYYKIKITDNGIGFHQDQALSIFEPFQRLHGKDKYEGTGIGLAICSKIAIKHNGFITAEGRPGHGATFNVFLPLT